MCGQPANSCAPARRLLAACGVAVLAVTTTGCLSASTVISIRPDGSATIRETVTLALHLLSAFGLAAGARHITRADVTFPTPTDSDITHRFGPGAQLTSCTPIDTSERVGRICVYEIKHIHGLSLRMGELAFLAERISIGVPVDGNDTFSFQWASPAAGRSTVTVREPSLQWSSDAFTPPGGDAELRRTLDTVRGSSLEYHLEFVGDLVSTTDGHVSGNRITLLAIDWETLFASLGAAKVSPPTRGGDVKTWLQGRPGVRLNPGPEVTFEFKGTVGGASRP